MASARYTYLTNLENSLMGVARSFNDVTDEYVLNSVSEFVAMNLPDLDSETIDRIIEMAWEDRTPFEAIEQQFGLQEKQVIALMRRAMKASSFKMWRERVSGRKTKHIKQRDFVSGRFRSQNQKGS